MYSKRSGLVLGFHGCDEDVVNKILNNKDNLRSSHNSYDWLGPGIYFWENSPARALEFARELKENPGKTCSSINNPAVIGAVIDLGNCLDLLEFGMLQVLKTGYNIIESALKNTGLEMPKNQCGKGSKELLLRYLDCYVIKTIHEMRNMNKDLPFDSIRSVFLEGDDLYPGSGFKEKNHIQICICNPNCIKGYFLPRVFDSKYPKV